MSPEQIAVVSSIQRQLLDRHKIKTVAGTLSHDAAKLHLKRKRTYILVHFSNGFIYTHLCYPAVDCGKAWEYHVVDDEVIVDTLAGWISYAGLN